MSFFDHTINTVERSLSDRTEDTGKFWGTDDPTVNEKGNVTRGGMFPHQRDWWKLENFIRVLVGGFGCGKTLIGAKRIIGLALENAPIPVACVSPTFSVARETIILTIAELLAGKKTHYGRAMTWTYNATIHEFRIRLHGRNARIIVYSGERPESLRGPNLAAGWIDEPFLMDEEVFNQMIARIRHPDTVRSELNLTGTPEQLNWGYELCEGELGERHDVGFLTASTRDNLALDPLYVPRLESAYTGKASAAYVDGEFVNLSKGIVYYGFDPRVNVKSIPEIPPGAELGCGMDFNVDPFACIVFWRLGDYVHVIKEYQLPNADTPYVLELLREDWNDSDKRPNGPYLYTIFPDASGIQRRTSAPGGKSDYSYIRDARFVIDAPRANPLVRDRENAVNGKLAPRRGEPTLTIDPGCKGLIKALSTYTHELKHTRPQKRLSHVLDAFGYPIHRLFPHDRRFVLQTRVRGL